MELDRLWIVADRARARQRMESDDIKFVRDVLPKQLAAFPRLRLPKTIRHPAGFSISGAPAGTLLRSALLLAGRKVLGDRYRGSPFYENVEKDLAFAIMRSNFHNGYPKGAHCCAQCTLAVYPVLEARAIRYFDCAELSRDVKRLVEQRKWRFAGAANPGMVRWAFRDGSAA